MATFSRREFAGWGLSVLSGLSASAAGTKDHPTPASVHAELVAGNSRFVTGHARHPHSSRKWLRRTAREGQHPHAIVLCCSDSRVAPELLFDQGVGDLFVVRVAGNVLREDEVGSIEYAVEHLHVPLCVVLGHTACGAVGAVAGGDTLQVEVDHLVAPIREALEAVKAHHDHPAGREELVNATAKEHARRTRDRMGTVSAFLSNAIASHSLRAEAGLYHLDTGRVEWL